MKIQLLAAAMIVLASGAQAFGQSCGCEATPIVSHHAHHGGCHHCCDPCHRPLLELVEGIGFTLKKGACHLRNGVHRLFHPITFHGCGCDHGCGCVVEPACGCGAPIGNTYEFMPHEEQIIEKHSAPHSIPAPPRVPSEATPTSVPTSSEPDRFQAPGKWQPTNTQGRGSKAAAYTSRSTGTSTARAATYYAPSRTK